MISLYLISLGLLTSSISSPTSANIVHPSWLEKPKHAIHEPQCAETQCQCGEAKLVFRRLSNNPNHYQLNSSVQSLPYLWKKYDKKVGEFESIEKSNSKYSFKLLRLQHEACLLAIHQLVINNHYSDVSNLHNQAVISAETEFNKIQIECETKCSHERKKVFRKAKKELKSAKHLLGIFNYVSKNIIVSRDDDKKNKQIKKLKREDEKQKRLDDPVLQAAIKKRKDRTEARNKKSWDKIHEKERLAKKEIDDINTHVVDMKSFTAKEQHLKGFYLLNANGSKFTVCYQKESLWLTAPPDVMQEIKTGYKKVFRRIEKPVFLSLIGVIGPASEYGGTLKVNKVLRLLRKGEQCGEYYGIDSLDIHPTWFEAPKTGIAKVNCDATYCYCQKTKLAQIQADSKIQFLLEQKLSNLKWAWSRFEKNKSESEACNILLLQKIIQPHYSKFARKLSLEFKQYKDSIVKEEAKCIHPEEMGWTQSEKAKEYVTCMGQVRSKVSKFSKKGRGIRMKYRQFKQKLRSLLSPRGFVSN